MTPANHTQPLPALLAALTAIAILTALAGGAPWPPPALWHLVFAAAALPLIFAAMIYFVPVLTRTPEPSRTPGLMPLAALTAGVAIVGWFVSGHFTLRVAAPWLALGATAAMAAWMAGRRRRCLGRPHPCLYWYGAALACLTLGLGAVAASARWPALAAPLRLFHLHVNLLGFMGLTAIGTLQVLLPTVLGKPDPGASQRLVRDLPWSLAGALAIAAGSATWWPLAAAGAAAYAWPLLRMTLDVAHHFRRTCVAPGQPAPLLLAAVAGLALLLMHGLAHGTTLAAGRDALPAFVVGFLLPLVSGAVTQLLPVWLRPGAQRDWQRAQRRRLAAFASTRAAALFTGGLLAGLGLAAGYALGAAGALWLLGVMALTVLKPR